jgi:hypothetical protein
MKITIETDSPSVQTGQPAMQVSSPPAGAPAAPPQADVPALGGGISLSDLLAKAASLGAQNAGPAPVLSSVTMGSAPISASVGGGQSAASMTTSSAGAPPSHVYGSQGGCK